jgi:NADPH:quinone reductase-like Zn-dependent oxidoreductase
MSPSVSFEQAASLPIAGCTALQGLRDVGKIQSGEKVLVNGAGGGVGSFAVQLAKVFGAEVTAVTSALKLDAAKAMGADYVVDYTREDFTSNGKKYDAIIDMGATHSWKDIKRALAEDGEWLLVGGVRILPVVTSLLGAKIQAPFTRQKVRLVPAKARKEDLTVLDELVSSGKIAPVIDRTFPLSQIREAVARLESGEAAGKVVITM